MSVEIIVVLVIIVIALVLFITEVVAVDAASIIVMALLMVTGILTAEEGLSGFSSAATGTVVAMFVLSAGLFKTGALNTVAGLLTRAAQKSYTLCLFAVLVLSGGLSAFLNDTAVVALLMPVVIGVARVNKFSPSRLLMPLSFGALFGGCCTLIGTSTNILVSSIAVRQGEPAFTMFEFAPFGLVVLITGTLYMVFVGSRILPDREVKEDLKEKYGMGKYLTDIILLPGSRSLNVAIKDAPLFKEMDIDLISIIRNGTRLAAHPSRILLAGDILQVRCDVEVLRQLRASEGVELKPEEKFQLTEANNAVLIEAIITPNSNFDGRTVKDISLRGKYGANVLAVRHHEAMFRERLGSVELRSGDVLLIAITRDSLNVLRDDSTDLLIVSDIEGTEYRRNKILPAFAIIAGVVLFAALGVVPIVVSAIIGSLLMVATGCLKPGEAYKAINWKVIFLLAGVLSLGVALEKTGAAKLLAGFMIETVGQYGHRVLLGTFFLITLLLTNFMSNNASAALLAPIAIMAAHTLGVSAKPFLMAVTYAASLSLMTPVGYQTNAMIYGPGNYHFSDYFKVGAPLDLILLLLAAWLIPLIFPF